MWLSTATSSGNKGQDCVGVAVSSPVLMKAKNLRQQAAQSIFCLNWAPSVDHTSRSASRVEGRIGSLLSPEWEGRSALCIPLRT